MQLHYRCIDHLSTADNATYFIQVMLQYRITGTAITTQLFAVYYERSFTLLCSIVQWSICLVTLTLSCSYASFYLYFCSDVTTLVVHLHYEHVFGLTMFVCASVEYKEHRPKKALLLHDINRSVVK